MRIFRKKRGDTDAQSQEIIGIRKGALDLIFAAAKDTYPREFMGMMRAQSGVIEEILILPGTTSGDSHAIFHRHMMPIDYSVVGTVHSHPSTAYRPSNADLLLFQRYGRVHIISARPYSMKTWRAYDMHGKERELKVL